MNLPQQADWFLFFVFLSISFAHFIPSYFLNKSQKSDSLGTIRKVNAKKIFKNVIRRFNYDIFRFNGDLSIIVLFLLFFKINKTQATWLFFALLLFGFIYLTYYHIVKKTYNSEPLLINDMIFLRTGITIAIGGFLHYTILFLLIFAFFVLGCFYASAFFINALYSLSSINIPLLITVVFSSSIALFSIVKYFNHPTIYSFLSCPSPTVHFFTNVFNSVKTLKVTKAFKEIDFEALQQVKSIKMTKKPNFHFWVSESYGRIFFKRAEKNESLNQKILTIENSLIEKGWKIVSNYSHAPISGGASWLSYSTLLKGIKIDTHNKYYTLLKDERHLSYYPFLKLMGNSGYKSFYLSALGGYEKVKINWKQLMNFIGAGDLIKFKDLEYEGRGFGLGPSPPDQFSINKGFDLMKRKYPNEPIAYFYITQNSHALWYVPDNVVKDWRILSDKNFDEYGYIEDKELSVRYEKAIIYQLETFANFVLQQSDNNLYLIIGDHQPYSDEENEDDYLTPIHIISKDKEFLELFKKFGFTNGLLPLNGNEITHEAVHSMLLHNLQKRYGAENKPVIEYRKNGIWS